MNDNLKRNYQTVSLQRHRFSLRLFLTSCMFHPSPAWNRKAISNHRQYELLSDCRKWFLIMTARKPQTDFLWVTMNSIRIKNSYNWHHHDSRLHYPLILSLRTREFGSTSSLDERKLRLVSIFMYLKTMFSHTCQVRDSKSSSIGKFFIILHRENA